jgi:hypothetical protein
VARTLEFVYQGRAFKCGLNKVDRTSLYGSVDVETRDTTGSRCQVATLAQDRRTLIPSGGTALGHLTPTGTWVERGDLVAVNAQGNRINTVASSFDSPIELETKSGLERFLDHSIRSSYLLETVDEVPAPLKTALDAGTIFKFDFSYRGGSNPDPAFLMKGLEDALWMLVGDSNEVTFVGFAQATALAPEDAAAEAGDDLDFEMM